MDSFEIAAQYGIVPVINIPREELAVPLAQALTEGGLPLIEVTMRNPNSLAALRRIKREMPSMLAGAGTILTTQQVDEALDAGADFAVAPGFSPEVVEYCQKKGLPILPGCVTASEIEAGRRMGLRLFKFFPSEQLGGVKTIKELCGPYRDIQFVPTSGINLQNLPAYMCCEGVAAVGGSFMAPAALVAAEDWAGITALCRTAVNTALGFHLKHVGLNAGDEEKGAAIARRFAEIFGMPYLPGNRSDFAGTVLESCKVQFPGEKGHIAIGTYSVERAVAYLQRKNVPIRQEFLNVDPQGRMIAAYLEEEIGGFAVHLLRSN